MATTNYNLPTWQAETPVQFQTQMTQAMNKIDAQMKLNQDSAEAANTAATNAQNTADSATTTAQQTQTSLTGMKKTKRNFTNYIPQITYTLNLSVYTGVETGSINIDMSLSRMPAGIVFLGYTPGNIFNLPTPASGAVPNFEGGTRLNFGNMFVKYNLNTQQVFDMIPINALFDGSNTWLYTQQNNDNVTSVLGIFSFSY